MSDVATYTEVLRQIDEAVPKAIGRPQSMSLADGRSVTFSTLRDLTDLRRYYGQLLHEAQQSADGTGISYPRVSP